jgi:hypothetical protein
MMTEGEEEEKMAFSINSFGKERSRDRPDRDML